MIQFQCERPGQPLQLAVVLAALAWLAIGTSAVRAQARTFKPVPPPPSLPSHAAAGPGGLLTPGRYVGSSSNGQPNYVNSVSAMPGGAWNVELGPKLPSGTKVLYLGLPQSTQTLPDGSTLYMWDLRTYAMPPGTQTFHPRYFIPPGTTFVVQGLAPPKTLWVLAGRGPNSLPELMNPPQSPAP